MTAPKDDLFRDEAVQAHRESRTRAQLLRVSPAWSSWLFWVIAAAALGGFLFVATARMDHWVRGRAVILDADGGREVAAFLPASARSLLAPGQDLLVRIDSGDAALALRVDVVADEIVGPEGARERVGAAAELLDLAGPSVAVRAALPDPPPGAVPGAAGIAEVRVGRRTLLAALLPGGAP